VIKKGRRAKQGTNQIRRNNGEEQTGLWKGETVQTTEKKSGVQLAFEYGMNKNYDKYNGRTFVCKL
jgi:hypothetical protein